MSKANVELWTLGGQRAVIRWLVRPLGVQISGSAVHALDTLSIRADGLTARLIPVTDCDPILLLDKAQAQ